MTKRTAIVVALLVPALAFGVPVVDEITGPLDNGSTITILGTGLGTKPYGDAPEVWDTWETGTNNLEIQDIDPSLYPILEGFSPPYAGLRYSNTHAYSGALSVSDERDLPSRGNWVKAYGQGDAIYVSYWAYIDADPSIHETATNSVQIKWPRLQSDYNIAADEYNLLGETRFGSHTWTAGQYSQFDNGINGNTQVPGPDNDTASDNLEYMYMPPKTWVRVEMYRMQSTPGVADGRVGIKVYDDQLHRNHSYMTVASGYSFKMTGAWLGPHITDNTPTGWVVPNFFVYMDDFYLDDSLCRAVLADSPDYDTAIQIENQIPQSWDPTAVTVTVNTGTFTTGTPVWLFVFDDNGDFGTPLGLIIGADYEPVPITAPANLTLFGGN